MRIVARWVLLAVAATCGSGAAAGPAQEKDLPAAGEIIAKAVAWAKWHRERNFHTQWTFEHTNTARHLNDDEQIQSTGTRHFQVYPLSGEQYYEWVRDNGEPLSPSDQFKEQKRKEKFIEQAGKKATGDSAGDDEDETDIRFDQELISRYDSEVVGTEEINGRTAYVLRFYPKSGPLPVRRRADHALNKSRGRLWIDTAEFVVLRVEFELMEPVRLWAGLLGSISRLRGRLTLAELGGGAWYYKEIELHMKGRIFIKPFHEDRLLEWTNSQPVPPSSE
jgi:hypothetical protein